MVFKPENTPMKALLSHFIDENMGLIAHGANEKVLEGRSELRSPKLLAVM